MIKKFFLCASLCLLCLCAQLNQAQAQTDEITDYQRMEQEIVSGNLSDEDMFNKYSLLIWHYYAIDFEKSYDYFKKAIALARDQKKDEWEARALTALGDIYAIFNVRKPPCAAPPTKPVPAWA